MTWESDVQFEELNVCAQANTWNNPITGITWWVKRTTLLQLAFQLVFQLVTVPNRLGPPRDNEDDAYCFMQGIKKTIHGLGLWSQSNNHDHHNGCTQTLTRSLSCEYIDSKFNECCAISGLSVSTYIIKRSRLLTREYQIQVKECHRFMLRWTKISLEIGCEELYPWLPLCWVNKSCHYSALWST